MKRTLIITLEHPPQIGGIATYVHSLAQALDPAKTIVLAEPHAGALEWDKAQSYRIIRHRLLLPRSVWPRWLLLVWRVHQIVREYKIELIMVHHALPVGYAGVIMKKIHGVPFLLFSHGTDLIAGTANWWKKKMLRFVARQAQEIFFNSASLERRFLERLAELEGHTSIIYPCPDADFLVSPAIDELRDLRHQYALEGKQVILSIARLDDGKGFPHLVRYVSELVQTTPNIAWVIIGDGPKKQEIIELIQLHNLQNIVRFLGDLPHAEIKKFYYVADVFVVLTHPDQGREEGLGLVFLEASAAGVPIIAGQSGGVEEAVMRGETGLVVDTYQKTMVLAALRELLRNPTYARMLGRQAQERIQANFRWEHQVKRLEPWIE